MKCEMLYILVTIHPCSEVFHASPPCLCSLTVLWPSVLMNIMNENKIHIFTCMTHSCDSLGDCRAQTYHSPWFQIEFKHLILTIHLTWQPVAVWQTDKRQTCVILLLICSIFWGIIRVVMNLTQATYEEFHSIMEIYRKLTDNSDKIKTNWHTFLWY